MSVMSAIYGGGPFYTGGQAVIDDLKASQFTTVVAWAMHIQANADLVFNDPTNVLVQNGAYAGDPAWPGLLADLKQGQTSVNRLIFSVGGWGVQDFPNLKQLIFPSPSDYPNNPQTGTGTVLYQNFAALKAAIPTIDAIDFDDETLYDEPTTIAFANMLYAIGFNVTFCPYTNTSFWTNCLKALNTATPGLVTGFNLQCYAGGAGNDPSSWISAIQTAMGSGFDAAGFVFPGLWCINGNGCSQGQCPSSIQSTFAGWKSTGIGGGFIWLYDDIQKCEGSGACGGGVAMGSQAYADAIINGLS
ncbi:lysyl endopeptidase [Roseibium litorale]|uniref:Lysyl endopeptidase n=1 Tax=Roseibium litorale TaxID=2803841 RepID=A0ABR9CGE0_9HYPH|nr:lysyl endopeptidase [Roseibium litorale]MBD8889965.1 lysyl endopeptidase [Roseibium litorale]